MNYWKFQLLCKRRRVFLRIAVRVIPSEPLNLIRDRDRWTEMLLTSVTCIIREIFIEQIILCERYITCIN